MRKTLSVALVALLAATTLSTGAEARRGNPPGPAGGPGTNWANPPGPRGGPGASPYRWWLGNPPGPVGGPGHGPLWRHRAIPGAWAYWGLHGPYHWYWHPHGYWYRFDRDGNPPGPIGGPGASPNSPYRPC